MIATAADAPMSVPSGFMSSGFMSEPTAQPMADRDHRAMPCHKGMNDCRSIDACAVKCFNFPGASVSVLPFPIVLTDGGPMLAVSGFRPQASRAPFRPPRI
ncbi:MAG: hypothetical protein K2Z80_33610 [Xanthobacteraceae bacterium]|nr:hypothetical protein [Xanthobacteraceae bacterium]